MTEIHGTCDDEFEPVQAAMAANFDSGQELGASVCATVMLMLADRGEIDFTAPVAT